MADPEMIFWKALDGEYYPIYYKQVGLGIEQFSAELTGDEESFGRFNPRMQADQTSFANTWMKNIKYQQGL